MKTVFSEKHKLRNAKTELYGGQLVKPFERPSRAEFIINRVKDENLGPVIDPQDHGMDAIYKVHDRDYVDFMQSAWDQWQAEDTMQWLVRHLLVRVPGRQLTGLLR